MTFTICYRFQLLIFWSLFSYTRKVISDFAKTVHDRKKIVARRMFYNRQAIYMMLVRPAVVIEFVYFILNKPDFLFSFGLLGYVLRIMFLSD